MPPVERFTNVNINEPKKWKKKKKTKTSITALLSQTHNINHGKKAAIYDRKSIKSVQKQKYRSSLSVKQMNISLKKEKYH